MNRFLAKVVLLGILGAATVFSQAKVLQSYMLSDRQDSCFRDNDGVRAKFWDAFDLAPNLSKAFLKRFTWASSCNFVISIGTILLSMLYTGIVEVIMVKSIIQTKGIPINFLFKNLTSFIVTKFPRLILLALW